MVNGSQRQHREFRRRAQARRQACDREKVDGEAFNREAFDCVAYENGNPRFDCAQARGETERRQALDQPSENFDRRKTCAQGACSPSHDGAQTAGCQT